MFEFTIMATTLPVTVSSEAGALADDLRLRAQLDQMIERAIEGFPNLKAVEVIRYDLVDEPGYPRIVIQLLMNGPRDPDDYWVRREQWDKWTCSVFAPTVHSTVSLRILYPDEFHAR